MNKVSTLRSALLLALLCFSLAIIGCGQKASAPTEPEKAASTKETADTDKAAPSTPSFSTETSGKSTVWTSTDGDNNKTTMTVTEEEDGAIIEISSDDEEMIVKSGSQAKIPDGFPKDIPVPDTIGIEAAMEIGGSTFTLTGIVTQSYDEITAYYRKECVAQGWTESMNMSQGGEEPMTILGYEKDGRVLSVVVGANEDAIRVNLSTSFEED